MEDMNTDAHFDDPVWILAQSLIGSKDSWSDVTDFRLRNLSPTELKQNRTTDLIHNIQLLSALNNGSFVEKYDAIRSSLSPICENLRIFVVEVVYKNIINEVENRETKSSKKDKDGYNEELLLLLYLTTYFTQSLIQFEHNFLTSQASKTASSVLNNDSLAVLSSVLHTLLGLCTNVEQYHTHTMQINTQERMLLLRETAKSLPKSSGVSAIQEISVVNSTDIVNSVNSVDSDVFTPLSEAVQVPPPYHTHYTSTALLHTITSNTTNKANTTLRTIIHTIVTQLAQLCSVISTNSANRSNKTAKNINTVDNIIREDRTAVLTQSIINIARCWNASPSSVVSDRLAAHALLCVMNPTTPNPTNNSITTNTTTYNTTLTSAAFTALVPVAMRLLNRYEPSLHTLALVVLYRASNATPPGLLSSFLDWILPHLYSYIEIVSDDWSRLMAVRIVQSLLCCDVHSSIALQHAHLYIESSIRQLQLKPSVAFAWPYLHHMHRLYTTVPVGVLCVHSSALVGCYLQLLNVWHLPLQNQVLESMAALIKRLDGTGLAAELPKITTELIRLNIFYHSPQNDISTASAADIKILLHNSIVVSKQARTVDSSVWDTFVNSVLHSVVGMKGINTSNTSSSVRTAGADEHVIKVIKSFISTVSSNI